MQFMRKKIQLKDKFLKKYYSIESYKCYNDYQNYINMILSLFIYTQGPVKINENYIGTQL